MKSGNELRAYHRYMTQIAILLGADRETAATEMLDVIDFETTLANVSDRLLGWRSLSHSSSFFVGLDV